MATITFRGIKAKQLQVKAIRDEVVKALKDEAKIHRKKLSEPVSSWNNPPRIETDFRDTPNILQTITGPTGDELSVNKFVWLDKGTRIRWALMSADWKSKTSPHSFRSGRGSGRAVIVGKRAMRQRNIAPRPGIEARGWTDDLAKEREKPFQLAMSKAVASGAKKVYN